MNDIFKHWGIEHLSPSSINMYIADPLQWIIHKLCKIPMKGSPAMWRGNIVDQSVGSYIKEHTHPNDYWQMYFGRNYA